MKPSRFRRYWPLLIVLPLLAFGVRMLTIRPLALVSQGPIGNGQMLSGSVGYGNTDTWSFNETAGGSIIVNVDTPNVQTDFEPSLAIYNPDGTVLAGFTAGWPGVRQIATGTLTQNGTYTAQVKNYDSTMVTGTANINLNLAAMPYTIAPGASGGIMYSSTNYSGTIGANKINMNMWTYALKAGDFATVSMTPTAGVLG